MSHVIHTIDVVCRRDMSNINDGPHAWCVGGSPSDRVLVISIPVLYRARAGWPAIEIVATYIHVCVLLCRAIVMASPRKSDSSDDSSLPSRDYQRPEDPPVQPAGPDPSVQRSRPPRPSSRARPCGYDCEFVERPPAQVQCECPVCLQVLRDPQQVTCCGNSFCKVCIDRVKKNGKPCPTCNVVAFSIFPNKGLRRTLGGFRVYCSNKDEGCEWVGELGDIERHLNSKPSPERQLEGCLFEEVACIYCTCLFQRRYINPHQSNDECPKRPYVCKHCGHDATYEEVMQGHYQALVEVQSREPEQHVDLSGCPLEIVACDFHGIGCQVELPRRDVPAHLGRKVVSHSAFLLSTAQRTMSNVVTVQSGQNEMQASLARLQEMVDAQDGGIKELQDENRRLQASLQEAVTAQEVKMNSVRDENRRLWKHQRNTNARLFWGGLALVFALAAIGIGIAVGNVRDEEMASVEIKPESLPLDNGILENESENMAVTLAQTLKQVGKDVATEKSERDKMAKSLEQVEKDVATEKSERDKMAKSLEPVEKDVATEKSERDKMAKSLEQVEKDVATEKSERDKMAKSLEQVEKDVATEKSERGKMAQSLEQVGKDVATEKSKRGKMAKSLEQVKKDVATEKSKRENTTESLAQVKKEMATAKRERKNTTDILAQVKWEVAKERSARQKVTDTLAQNLANVKTEVATEKSEREQIRDYLKRDEKISMRETMPSENSNAAIDDVIEKIQTRQSLVLNHLKMIPHEVALSFEFTMHNFQKYKADDRMWESPPFYTHSHGYTLCIVIQVNTYWFRMKYISVYAYLMPGAFDDDLKWPFRGNVTIELINQAETSRWNPASYVSSRKVSHADSFDFAAKTRDNPEEVSQRVMSGKKALYGKEIRHFIAHSALAVEGIQYLKDDSLKFRISKVTNIL